MDNLFIFGAQYLYIFSILFFVSWMIKKSPGELKTFSLFSILSLGLTLVIGKILNLFVVNPRPFVKDNFTPLIEHATDNGFPSDHMLLVAGLAAVVTAFNKKLGLVLWLLAIVVGFSRVYVGVHHYVDILGSTTIAILSTSLIYIILKSKRMI